jgi:hypothetical protein
MNSVDDERARYLYPSGQQRLGCSTDNDGYPLCQGDGSLCGYSRLLGQQVCENLPAE